MTARRRLPDPSTRQTLLLLGAIALLGAVVGIHAHRHGGGPAPAVAATAAAAPLYVLPEQPAARVGASHLATPGPPEEPWQLTLHTARHPEP